MTEKELPFCECGCGKRVSKVGNRFLQGHNGHQNKGKKRTPEHCAARSIAMMGEKNHNFGKARTPETCAKISSTLMGVSHSFERCATNSAAHKGVSLSPEHCAAISAAGVDRVVSNETRSSISATLMGHQVSNETRSSISLSLEESGANEAMRGGNDIVNHHFIYDHLHPENHIVEITRSQHTAHHWWMRRNGLKVPHLNANEENTDIFKR